MLAGEDTFSLEGLIAAWTEHERRYAALCRAAHRLDVEGGWADTGAVSMSAWMRQHCRVANRTARTVLRHGRFLERFAAFAAAADDATLSFDQIVAMRQNLNPITSRSSTNSNTRSCRSSPR
jgi:hypothetical protein